MSTRRQFLGTLGKALGAGSLLLPWAGKGALALPADLGKAAALPVAPTPLPVSAEMLRLREIRRELHHIYLMGPDEFPNTDGRQKAWRDVMRNQHTPTVEQILGRKKPTWQDCVEIAECCLHHMYRQRSFRSDDPMRRLVWAVLSAGGVEEMFVPEIGNLSLEGEEAREIW
jgi:hypothetical protein